MPSVKEWKRQLAKAQHDGNREDERRITTLIGTRLCQEEGKPKEALSYLEKGLELSVQLHGAQSLDHGLALRYLGECLCRLGEYKRALKALKTYLNIAFRLNNKVECQRALQTLGNTYWDMANEDEDEEEEQKGGGGGREGRDRANDGDSNNNNNNNNDNGNNNDLDEAELLFVHQPQRHCTPLQLAQFAYEKSLSLVQEIPKSLIEDREREQMKCGLYLNIGNVYDLQKNKTKALQLMTDSLEIAKSLHDEPAQARAHLAMGVVYTSLKKYDPAIKCHKLCLSIAQLQKDKPLESETLNNIAVALVGKLELKQARKFARRAYKIGTSTEDRLVMRRAADSVRLIRKFIKIKSKVNSMEKLLNKVALVEPLNDSSSNNNNNNNNNSNNNNNNNKQPRNEQNFTKLLNLITIKEKSFLEAIFNESLGDGYGELLAPEKAIPCYEKSIQILEAFESFFLEPTDYMRAETNSGLESSEDDHIILLPTSTSSSTSTSSLSLSFPSSSTSRPFHFSPFYMYKKRLANLYASLATSFEEALQWSSAANFFNREAELLLELKDTFQVYVSNLKNKMENNNNNDNNNNNSSNKNNNRNNNSSNDNKLLLCLTLYNTGWSSQLVVCEATALFGAGKATFQMNHTIEPVLNTFEKADTILSSSKSLLLDALQSLSSTASTTIEPFLTKILSNSDNSNNNNNNNNNLTDSSFILLNNLLSSILPPQFRDKHKRLSHYNILKLSLLQCLKQLLYLQQEINTTALSYCSSRRATFTSPTLLTESKSRLQQSSLLLQEDTDACEKDIRSLVQLSKKSLKPTSKRKTSKNNKGKEKEVKEDEMDNNNNNGDNDGDNDSNDSDDGDDDDDSNENMFLLINENELILANIPSDIKPVIQAQLPDYSQSSSSSSSNSSNGTDDKSDKSDDDDGSEVELTPSSGPDSEDENNEYNGLLDDGQSVVAELQSSNSTSAGTNTTTSSSSGRSTRYSSGATAGGGGGGGQKPNSLLKKKLNTRNERGETALHRAAIAGNLDICKQLILGGASVNAKDNAGWSPLHEACNYGFLDIVQYLLESGANINIRGLGGVTPLHDAAMNDHVDVVKLLLKFDADVFARDDQKLSVLDVAGKETYQLVSEVIQSRTKLKSNAATEGAAIISNSHSIKSASSSSSSSLFSSSATSSSTSSSMKFVKSSKRDKIALTHLESSDESSEDRGDEEEGTEFFEEEEMVDTNRTSERDDSERKSAKRRRRRRRNNEIKLIGPKSVMEDFVVNDEITKKSSSKSSSQRSKSTRLSTSSRRQARSTSSSGSSVRSSIKRSSGDPTAPRRKRIRKTNFANNNTDSNGESDSEEGNESGSGSNNEDIGDDYESDDQNIDYNDRNNEDVTILLDSNSGTTSAAAATATTTEFYYQEYDGADHYDDYDRDSAPNSNNTNNNNNNNNNSNNTNNNTTTTTGNIKVRVQFESGLTLLVPCSVKSTINWLIHESASRYLKQYGVEPIITALQTSDSAIVYEGDLVGDVLSGGDHFVTAIVSSWNHSAALSTLNSLLAETPSAVLDEFGIPIIVVTTATTPLTMMTVDQSNVTETFDLRSNLSEQLNQCDESQSFIASNFGLSDKIATALFRCLRQHTLIISLDLSENKLDDENVKELAASLRFLPNLARLNLSSNSFSSIGCRALLGALASTESSSSLINSAAVLSSTQIPSTAPSSISLSSSSSSSSSLEFSSKIQFLDLSYNSIGDGCADSLGDFLLKSGSRLVELCLDSCRLSPFTFRNSKVVEGLKTATRLCRLSLAHNKFQVYEDFNSLCTSLVESHVTQLNLGFTKLNLSFWSHKDEFSIFKLKFSTTLFYRLDTLCLSGVELSDSTCQALSELLIATGGGGGGGQEESHLRCLDLYHCSVSSNSALVLCDAFSQLSSLSKLRLRGNPIGGAHVSTSVIEKLTSSLAAHSQLSIIDLSSCSFTPEQTSIIMRALAERGARKNDHDTNQIGNNDENNNNNNNNNDNNNNNNNNYDENENNFHRFENGQPEHQERALLLAFNSFFENSLQHAIELIGSVPELTYLDVTGVPVSNLSTLHRSWLETHPLGEVSFEGGLCVLFIRDSEMIEAGDLWKW